LLFIYTLENVLEYRMNILPVKEKKEKDTPAGWLIFMERTILMC